MCAPPPVCPANSFCCPDAKHCLTPTAKVCGATAKCAADETCCPLTKVRSLSIVSAEQLRLSREVARPSLTTGRLWWQLCVKVGVACKSPCADPKSYCCPYAHTPPLAKNTRKERERLSWCANRDAKHCLTPVNPGHLCTADGEAGAKCAAGEVCCPLIKVRRTSSTKSTHTIG